MGFTVKWWRPAQIEAPEHWFGKCFGELCPKGSFNVVHVAVEQTSDPNLGQVAVEPFRAACHDTYYDPWCVEHFIAGIVKETWQQLFRLDVLGAGCWPAGEVTLAKLGDVRFVVQRLRKTPDESLHQQLSEVMALRQVRGHDYVAQLIDVFAGPGEINIVMVPCDANTRLAPPRDDEDVRTGMS